MAKDIQVGDTVSVPEITFLGDTVTEGQMGTVINLREPRKGWNRKRLVVALLDRDQKKQEFFERDVTPIRNRPL